MAKSYIEWAEEIAKKVNNESCTVTYIIMQLSKEMAKGTDDEKAKIMVANKMLNGEDQHEKVWL